MNYATSVLLALSLSGAPALAQATKQKSSAGPDGRLQAPLRGGAFLCLDTASGGVRFNEQSKRWEGVRFNATDRFVIRLQYLRTTIEPDWLDKKPVTTGYYRLSMSNPGPDMDGRDPMPCSPIQVQNTADPFDLAITPSTTIISCFSFFHYLWFNVRNNRFMLTYRAGFLDGDNPNNTPSVSVGTCTRIGD